MNQIKLKIYREVCLNLVEAEDFINSKIGEICSRERFCNKKVIYFDLYVLLLEPVVSFLNIKKRLLELSLICKNFIICEIS